MLELKNITKIYENSLNKAVLKNLNLRFNSIGLVSILGPSGAGKSTLLNIIGGLDRNYMGEVIVDGRSMNSFKESDFDRYRNHKIGFVFQNSTLIEHLSVLENISIKLKLSRCKEKLLLLEELGLTNYLNKKPNELSGGEILRVQVARALANNSSIILADEPTGALDSKNSIKIMEILKEISKTKLVIMVTHNEELARNYSDRIIRIKDGEIVSDSLPNEEIKKEELILNSTKFSFKDAIFLSFKNIITKKTRVLITSIAISVGIIGIALILSISNGINKYIKILEEDTAYSYPILIEDSVIDNTNRDINLKQNDEGKIYRLNSNKNVKKNDLNSLKTYLEEKGINTLSNNINYIYDLDLNIYRSDYQKLDLSDIFFELDQENLTNSFEIVKGRFPTKYNEIVLILNENNEIYDYTLDILGNFNKNSYNYEEFLGLEYKLVLSSKFYIKENDLYMDKSSDKRHIKKLVDEGEKIKIVGIIKPKEFFEIESNIGYLNDLTKYISDSNKKSRIYIEQAKNQNINVFTKTPFADEFNSSYEDNLSRIGVINNIKRILIYPKDIKAKDKIISLLKDKVTFSDYFKTTIDEFKNIVDITTTVLIAFVSISLLVSIIMIGIITYISVLERTHEIGVLRSIGASKRDIKRIFNAETFIIGLSSGLLGITIASFLNILINKIIFNYIELNDIASLSISDSIILILISISITMIGGVIPANIASNKDPIKALKCSNNL